MNRDEALRCFELGKNSFRNNDLDNALKFFKKSYRLEESDIVKKYIDDVENMKKNGGSSTTRTQQSQKAEPASKAEPTEQAAPKYTKEQVDDVKKIRATKDFYEILNVTKTATEDEIKKAYRKLALKYHPDKNRAPGSDEAFKKLAQAYDCLSNASKRKKYDEFGTEEPEQHYNHYRQYYNPEDIHPDDIFDMFFGMNRFHQGARTRFYRYDNGNGHTQQHQQQQGGQQRTPQAKYWSLLQFLPLIIIFLSSFALNFSREEPVYSLQQSYKYPTERETQTLRIKYFVDSSFHSNYVQKSGKLQQLDNEIETSYVYKLQQNCEVAKNSKRRLEMQAQYYSGQDRQNILNRAKQVDMSVCQLVQQIRNEYPHLVSYMY
jgi:DnaJ family protein B protein 12